MSIRRLGRWALLGCFWVAAAAQAHVPFLKPNQFEVLHDRFQVESSFTEFPFQADFAMDAPHFALVDPAGVATPLAPVAKTKAAVYLTPALPGEGTYRITTGVRKGPSYKAIETAEGKLYFADDMQRVQGKPVTMGYASSADVYVFKGAGAYQPQPLGKGVEIIPLTPPSRFVLGQPLRLRVLEDGQPVPGARVVVVAADEHYRAHRAEDLYDVEQQRKSTLVADERGEVTWNPAQAGLGLLFVTVHHKLSDTRWQSNNASLTLEVRLPAP